MKEIIVNISNRDLKKKINSLRSSGFVPAIIYSHGKTEHCKIASKEVSYIFSHGITESTILQLHDEKSKNKSGIAAYIKDYQKHPVSNEILHIDFFKVTEGEKIKTHIPIEFVGAAPGVKAGGVFEVFLRELEIETLPKYLQQKLQVNIEKMEIGDFIYVKDIVLPKETKVFITGNPNVCHVAPPTIVKEEEEKAEEKSEEKAEEKVDVS